MTDIVLAQFAKAPIAGQVKTRLIPEYTAQQAADVHRYLVRKTAENVSVFLHQYSVTNPSQKTAAYGVIHFQLWVSQQDGFLTHIAQEYGASLHRQKGSDLGDRLSHCAETSCKCSGDREQWVILIGSDCPYLDATDLANVISALHVQENDAVMIPADDGGYVLLGCKRFDASLFDGVEWSTALVAKQTLERMQNLSWRCAVLPPLADIDYAEDVNRYRSHDDAFASCCALRTVHS